MDLNELYSELLIDLYKKGRSAEALTDFTDRSVAHNPLCGDSIELTIKRSPIQIENTGMVSCGCAISLASAAALCKLVNGKSIKETRSLSQQFINFMRNEEEIEEELLLVFAGVKKFPMRIKCVTLPWHLLKDMINESD